MWLSSELRVIWAVLGLGFSALTVVGDAPSFIRPNVAYSSACITPPNMKEDLTEC